MGYDCGARFTGANSRGKVQCLPSVTVTRAHFYHALLGAGVACPQSWQTGERLTDTGICARGALRPPSGFPQQGKCHPAQICASQVQVREVRARKVVGSCTRAFSSLSRCFAIENQPAALLRLGLALPSRSSPNPNLLLSPYTSVTNAFPRPCSRRPSSASADKPKPRTQENNHELCEMGIYLTQVTPRCRILGDGRLSPEFGRVRGAFR